MVTVYSVLEMLASERFWGALVFAWMLTPIGFILVGCVLESRWVPLWHDQARGFIPGDIALGVVFAVGYYLKIQVEPTSWWRSPGFALVALMVSVAVFYVMRCKLDGPKYRPDELTTPTKRYHDYVLYLGYSWLLVYISLPGVLTGTTWGPENFGAKFVALMALVVWVVALIDDEKNPYVPSPRAHAYSYYPIWRKLPWLRQRMGCRW